MKFFEIKEETNLVSLSSILKAAMAFGFVHIVLVMNPNWFKDHILLGEVVAIIVMLLSMLSKKERNVSRISFDEEKKLCEIGYYIYFFIRISKVYSFEEINYRYGKTTVGRHVSTQAIQIRKNGSLVVELREQYNIGWEKEEIDAIVHYLQESKALKYVD
ncbi:hypothetical protein SIO70_25380 [Chitinophaga sancti]|uniref:hypothetical protein n=1 Tax=Chitinophaga sancti TaxID=1004 RepID=UPI002A74ADC8|nr:hypothetical protein [Chitinophaga sancti]WPQ61697.1 hypothetical protein SIO70_25380 [Chitinophaga sancti]